MEMDKLVKEYVQHLRVERDLSPSTIRSYASDLQRFLRTLDDEAVGRDVDSVTRQTIRKHIAVLRGEGLVSRSIARHISSLRTFWTFCVDNGYAAENPVAGVTVPKRPRKLPGYLSEEQCKQLLAGAARQTNAVKAFRDVAVITMLLHCGLRRAEVLALTMRDVDLRSAQVTVVNGKGHQSRVLPLTQQAVDALTDWLEIRPNAATDRLFVSTCLRPLSPHGLERLLLRAGAQAGIAERIHPHLLRHTFACLLLRSGANLFAISQLLGHSDINTTTVYLHATADDLRQEMDKHPMARQSV